MQVGIRHVGSSSMDIRSLNINGIPRPGDTINIQGEDCLVEQVLWEKDDSDLRGTYQPWIVVKSYREEEP